ncbi:estradiol 17-beta-dehydrogenase 11-like [Parus major]|uniref:estradiol 17-beta-dehydrogenase 11-like n=1 Tax=Parus major TaxID=9157 RepID=UPI0007714D04|nr:estradiol 17-beta-dehydrogenase 11-like [Parus major]
MNLILEVLLFLATLLYSYLEAFVKLFVPVRRKSLSGELVLITGAGHGVGRATALEFAKRQSRLVLWDINKHGVEETAAECQKLGATVQTFVVDCSKREEINSTAEKVKKDIGDVTILVNNAGVITAADFLSTQDHQIERMFEVNILGHMWTTRAFLPVMMNNNYGHIVTVASAAGHFVTPFMVTYCSSKFAAVGFHKALTEELSALGKDGIKTTCLCPVFINTGFVKNPTTRLGKILEVEEVVEALMEGIVTNQKMVFVEGSIPLHALPPASCTLVPRSYRHGGSPPLYNAPPALRFRSGVPGVGSAGRAVSWSSPSSQYGRGLLTLGQLRQGGMDRSRSREGRGTGPAPSSPTGMAAIGAREPDRAPVCGGLRWNQCKWLPGLGCAQRSGGTVPGLGIEGLVLRRHPHREPRRLHRSRRR